MIQKVYMVAKLYSYANRLICFLVFAVVAAVSVVLVIFVNRFLSVRMNMLYIEER